MTLKTRRNNEENLNLNSIHSDLKHRNDSNQTDVQNKGPLQKKRIKNSNRKAENNEPLLHFTYSIHE